MTLHRILNQTTLKTLTFAVLHFMVGFAVSYAFTGSLMIAGGIALVEPAINTIVFYVHETLWIKKTDAGNTQSYRHTHGRRGVAFG